MAERDVYVLENGKSNYFIAKSMSGDLVCS